MTGMIGGMAMGAYNGSQQKGGDMLDNVMMGMTMGMFTEALSGAAGGAVGGLWSPNTFGGMLLNAAAGGAAGGAVGGAVSAGLYGGNFWEGVGMGAAIGAGASMISSTLTRGLSFARQGRNFFSGKGVVELSVEGGGDYVAGLQRANKYNGSERQLYDTEFLVDRTCDEFGVGVGDIGITDLTTSSIQVKDSKNLLGHMFRRAGGPFDLLGHMFRRACGPLDLEGFAIRTTIFTFGTWDRLTGLEIRKVCIL